MNTNKHIDMLKNSKDIEKDFTDIYYEIIKQERLIVYSLIVALKTDFLKNSLKNKSIEDHMTTEEILNVYLSFENLFSEHYKEYKND